LSFAAVEVVILFILLKPPFFIQTDIISLLAFAVSVCLAIYLYFQITFININTTGLTAGNRIHITGMPFTQASSTNGATSFVIGKSEITSTAGVISAFFLNNTNYMGLSNEITTAAANSSAIVSQMTSNLADIYLSGTYEAA
jgi:hypothetical protein